jgi:hypothetical protein
MSGERCHPAESGNVPRPKGGPEMRLKDRHRQGHRRLIAAGTKTMNPYIAIVFGLMLILLSTASYAGPGGGPNVHFEISGLVIEETMTPAGHNLYESFNARWKALEGMTYTITIKERADSFRGSFYQISVDEDVVMAGRLNPRLDFIDALAEEAVKKCSLYILQRAFVAEELEFY